MAKDNIRENSIKQLRALEAIKAAILTGSGGGGLPVGAATEAKQDSLIAKDFAKENTQLIIRNEIQGVNAKLDLQTTLINTSGTVEQELRTTARTFVANEVKEFSYKVISGTVDVTIGGNLVTYPLADGTSGFNDLKNNSGLGEIIITPAASSSILLMYKLV